MKKALSSGAVISNEDFYNQLNAIYEEAFGHDAGVHNMIRKFLTLLPKEAQVLDCGCGTGKPGASMIVESGRRVHCIDLFGQWSSRAASKSLMGPLKG